MKKFFAGLMLLATMSVPVTFTSCDDDDVKTIIDLLDLIIGGDDLTNTSWLSSDSAYELDFQTGSQGYISFLDEDNEIQSVGFTYSISNEGETSYLTCKFSDTTWKFTVMQFEENKVLVLNDASDCLGYGKNATVTFYYVTDEEEGGEG